MFTVQHRQVLAASTRDNDSDPDGDPLTSRLVQSVTRGRLTLNPNGSFTYDPEDDFVGYDGFTYRVNDGAADSNVAIVWIEVTNTRPESADDGYFAVSKVPLVVPAKGVLENDSDADGDPLTAILVSPPAHGILRLGTDGSFTYESVIGFEGLDRFTYRASDGIAQSLIATVTIQVVLPHADIDTDSDNSGIIDHSVEEDALELDPPGNILRWNHDDDNGNKPNPPNGTLAGEDRFDAPFVDQNGQPMDDDDLEEFSIGFDSRGADLRGFKLRLENFSFRDLAVWETRDKRPLSRREFTLGIHPLPTLYVEGLNSGQWLLQLDLYSPAGTRIHSDIIMFTVLDMELFAYRPQTEGPGYGSPFTRWRIAHDEEDHVGIRRNGDDDNNNGLPDGTERGTVDGENDTIEFEYVTTLPGAAGVEYVLTTSQSSLNAWLNSIRSGELLFGTNGPVKLPGTTFWVDWANRSQFGWTHDGVEVHVRATNTRNVAFSDAIVVSPFNSTVIMFSGETFRRGTQIPPGMSITAFAEEEYRHSGYDIHYYSEQNRGLGSDPWNEVVNAVNNRAVTQVAIMGHSHGGGATYEFAEWLAAGADGRITGWYTLALTGYIDAVSQWESGGVDPENRRPPATVFHTSQYQRNVLPMGGPSGGNDDINRSYLGVNHATIAQHLDVLGLLRQRIRQRVLR